MGPRETDLMARKRCRWPHPPTSPSATRTRTLQGPGRREPSPPQIAATHRGRRARRPNRSRPDLLGTQRTKVTREDRPVCPRHPSSGGAPSCRTPQGANVPPANLSVCPKSPCPPTPSFCQSGVSSSPSSCSPRSPRRNMMASQLGAPHSRARQLPLPPARRKDGWRWQSRRSPWRRRCMRQFWVDACPPPPH